MARPLLKAITVKIVEGLDRVIGSGSETAVSENFGGGFLSLSGRRRLFRGNGVVANRPSKGIVAGLLVNVL